MSGPDQFLGSEQYWDYQDCQEQTIEEKLASRITESIAEFVRVATPAVVCKLEKVNEKLRTALHQYNVDLKREKELRQSAEDWEQIAWVEIRKLRLQLENCAHFAQRSIDRNFFNSYSELRLIAEEAQDAS